MIIRNKQWFIDRIGKRIYRKKQSCPCKMCQKIYVDIWDGKDKQGRQMARREFGARWLYDCQWGLQIEYFDKPEQIKYSIYEICTSIIYKGKISLNKLIRGRH